MRGKPQHEKGGRPIEATTRYLTVLEVQQRLKIGRSLAYELMHRKGFPSARIGRKIVVSERALEAWIEAGGTDQREGA